MDKVTYKENFDVFADFFNDLKNAESEVILWQLGLDDSKNRIIKIVTLQDFAFVNKDLQFKVQGEDNLPFSYDIVYCYSERKNVLFKTLVANSVKGIVTVKLPSQMNFLGEEGGQKCFDSIFAKPKDVNPVEVKTVQSKDGTSEKSISTRKSRFVDGTTITVVREEEIEVSKSYVLKEFNDKGFSFVVYNKYQFTKGEKVYLTAVGGKIQNPAIVGSVVGAKSVDEHGLEFKVGVKILEG